MIALPFVFLGLWLLHNSKRSGFSPSLYLIFIYFITAFASIIIFLNNWYTSSCPKLPLGFFAPILYCFLLWFCISPFTNLKETIFDNKKSLKGLNLIVYVYAAMSLITLLVSYSKIHEIFTVQNFVEVRNTQYTEEAESFYNHLTGIPRYIAAICSLLSPSSYIMIFIFLFSITYLKKAWWFNLLALFGSFTPLIISINVVDRSQFIFWILLFGFSLTFFYKKIPPKVKSLLLLLLMVLGTVLIIYMALISIARFEERDSGTIGGLVTYMGQNYLNFCNWFNYVEPGFYFDRILPVTGKYLIHIEPTKIVFAKEMQPYEVTGFGTVFASLYTTAGFIYLIFVCIIYRLVSYSIIMKANRASNCLFKYTVYVWALSVFLILGLFSNFFVSETSTYALIIWILIGHYLGKSRHNNVKKIV